MRQCVPRGLLWLIYKFYLFQCFVSSFLQHPDYCSLFRSKPSPDRGRRADRPLMNSVDSAVSRYCDLLCRRIRCSYQKYPLPKGKTKQKQSSHIHISVSLYERPFRKLSKFTCLLEAGASLYIFIPKNTLQRIT